MSLNIDKLLNGTARHSSHVYRYSSHPVIRRESTADHMHHTTSYCLMMAWELIERGYQVDIGKVLSRACIHDIEESGKGDIRRDVKHSDPKLTAMLERVGEMFVERISHEMGVDAKLLLDTWSSSKDGSLEGQILRTADALNVVAYITEELDMGNKLILPIFNEVNDYLNATKAKVTNPVLMVWLNQIVEKNQMILRREHMIAHLPKVIDALSQQIKELEKRLSNIPQSTR